MTKQTPNKCQLSYDWWRGRKSPLKSEGDHHHQEIFVFSVRVSFSLTLREVVVSPISSHTHFGLCVCLSVEGGRGGQWCRVRMGKWWCIALLLYLLLTVPLIFLVVHRPWCTCRRNEFYEGRMNITAHCSHSLNWGWLMSSTLDSSHFSISALQRMFRCVVMERLTGQLLPTRQTSQTFPA